jgi:esterase/lipase superfamily enzyme
MRKDVVRWHSDALGRYISMAAWGHYGDPWLVMPTAGGDAEEIERFGLIDAMSHLIDAGRVKIYSVDSVGGSTFLRDDLARQARTRTQTLFHRCVGDEVVPRIREDCRSSDIEIGIAGASLGAFSSVALLCRRPDLLSKAIAMSGTYDLTRFIDGYMDQDLYLSSPIHFLPNLGQGAQLEMLRKHFVLLAFCQGRWEDPGETWRMAEVLGAQGIPNRVDAWSPEYDHDWPSWRAMLPTYLEELVPCT